MVKLNSAAAIEWNKTIGGKTLDVLQTIELTSDGGYLLGGHSRSGRSGEKSETNRGNEDYWAVKLSPAGGLEWDKTIGGSHTDYLYDIKEIAPGNYIAGGWSFSGQGADKTFPLNGNSDYWLVELVYRNHALTDGMMTSAMPGVHAQTEETDQFRVYPNPVSSVLTIQTKEKALFILTDPRGNRLVTKSITGSGTIAVSRFAPGLYYLTNATTGKAEKVLISR